MSFETTKVRKKTIREPSETDRAFTERMLDGAADGGGPAYRSALREGALERLESQGIPRAKDEEWRFLRLRPLTETDFVPVEAVESEVTDEMVASRAVEEAAGQTLVFVNGQFDPALSDVSGFSEDIHVGQLSEPGEEDEGTVADKLGRAADVFDEDYFASLNAAGFRDGAYVIVPPDTAVEGAVHLLHFATEADKPYVSHSRNLVVVGRGSKMRLVEEYTGAGSGVYFNNALTEVSLGEGANVDHVKIQGESDDAYHMGRRAIDMEDWATYNSRTIAYGAKLSRFDIHSRGDGEEIDCTLDGLAVLGDKQISDTHSVMDHRQGHAGSHQLHKMILDDQSHAVFNGKIFVQQHAQKIDAYQLNRTLLLSDRAKVNTKPQLEIFADDVSCTHGATIGQLEDDQLFYLQTRAIDEVQARQMLVFGFAAEILDGIEVESVRKRIADEIAERTVI